MFGLGFGEILVLIIVGIVVVGPKNLPTLMRTTGRWIAKLRRMSHDLRSQSGIDDLIRQEGLEKEIHELRSLSRVNVIDTLVAPAIAAAEAPMAMPPPRPRAAPLPAARPEPLREREYPLIGCDAYGAMPDDAVLYTEAATEAAAAAPVEPAGGDDKGEAATEHEAAADGATPAAAAAAETSEAHVEAKVSDANGAGAAPSEPAAP